MSDDLKANSLTHPGEFEPTDEVDDPFGISDWKKKCPRKRKPKPPKDSSDSPTNSSERT